MKNGVCLPPSSFFSTYTSAENLVCGWMLSVLLVLDLSDLCPLYPRRSAPMLSPASAWSSSYNTYSSYYYFSHLLIQQSLLLETFRTPLSTLPSYCSTSWVENTSYWHQEWSSTSLSGSGIYVYCLKELYYLISPWPFRIIQCFKG